MIDPLTIKVGDKLRVLKDNLAMTHLLEGSVQEVFKVELSPEHGIVINTEVDLETYGRFGGWVFGENLKNSLESHFNYLEIVND